MSRHAPPESPIPFRMAADEPEDDLEAWSLGEVDDFAEAGGNRGSWDSIDGRDD